MRRCGAASGRAEPRRRCAPTARQVALCCCRRREEAGDGEDEGGDRRGAGGVCGQAVLEPCREHRRFELQFVLGLLGQKISTQKGP